MLALDIVRKQCKRDNIPFPRHIIRNEDNTCKENKAIARFLFDLLYHSSGIFDSCDSRYFPVGHTHWKCDQCFSCFAKV